MVNISVGAMKDTDALNGQTISAVGELLGIKLPREGMTRCPLPGHKDDTPSFQVKSSGRRWICYGCNQSGGSIDLVKSYFGMTFLEAKAWLSERSGLVTTRWNRLRRPIVSKSSSRPKVFDAKPQAEIEVPPDHVLYAALLTKAPLLQSGLKYLRGRGFDVNIVEKFGIGQMPSRVIVRSLLEEFGFERVVASGLLTKSSSQVNWWPIFPEGALLLPYFEAGKIAYFQARLIEERAKGDRWRNLNNRRRRIYNVDVLYDLSIKHLAICEGALDVISANQLGRQAIGLIGTTAGLSPAEIVLLRGRQVDLLLDWDPPGEQRAATLRKELRSYGVAATRKTAPKTGAKDINDYLRHGNGRL